MKLRTPTYQTNNQHIRIIKVTRTGILLLPCLIETNLRHAVPGVSNVTCSSPAIATNLFSPFPNISHTILAEAEHDIAINFIKCLTHDDIWFLLLIQSNSLRNFAVRTPVIFNVIESPISPATGIFIFELIRSSKTCTGGWTGRRIDP